MAPSWEFWTEVDELDPKFLIQKVANLEEDCCCSVVAMSLGMSLTVAEAMDFGP